MVKRVKLLFVVLLITGMLLPYGLHGGYAAGQDKTVSFDFRGAEIDHVLQFLSAASGMTVVKDPAVTGPVTVISQTKITIEQAIALLRSVLEVKGFTILVTPGLLKVLSVEAAKRESQVVSADEVSADDGVITVILPLSRLRAVEVQKELAALFAGAGSGLLAEAQTNTLIITDTASHVMFVVDLVKNLESYLGRTGNGPGLQAGLEAMAKEAAKSSARNVLIKVVPLFHADAPTLARELAQILYTPAGQATQVNPNLNSLLSLVAARRKDGASGQDVEKALTRLGQALAQGAAPAQAQAGAVVPNKVVADTRTNSLIVTGAPEVVSSLEALARTLDEAEETGAADFVTFVHKLQFADANAMANLLNQITAGFAKRAPQAARAQKAAGGGSGAPASSQEAGGGSQAGRLYADLSTQVVWVVPDPNTNALIVTVSRPMVDAIKEVVAELDQAPPTGVQVSYVYQLKHAKAADLAKSLTQFFSSGNAGVQLPASLVQGIKSSAQMQEFVRAQQQLLRATTSKSAGAGIRIVAEPNTNSLLIAAPSDSLEGVKEIVAQLDQEVPSSEQAAVTVYRLQNAKATELANLLNDLFMGASQQGTKRVTQTKNASGNQGTAKTKTAQTADPEQARQQAAATYQQRTGAQFALGTALGEEVRFVPDLPTNSLLIIAPPKLLEMIRGMVGQLDVMPAQVLIEATVVEVALDKGSEFGINWSPGSGGGGTNSGSVSLGAIAGALGLKYNLIAGDWRITVQALADSGKLNVLSNPKVMAANNSPAVINIGEQVPYLQSTREDAAGVVQKYYGYKNVGIALEVTPRIGESGSVFLDLFQTTSNLVPGTGQNEAPTIATRDTTTTIIVKDGQTLVIGGLIRDNTSVTTRKVPILGDLFLLGALFRHTTTNHQKTELMIFITPRIVRSPEEANQLTAAVKESTTAP
ncbi:MAG: secretin N-terminal domain-containing protein [Bacteroidota bacterium]